MTFRGGATAAPQRVHVCSCHGLPTRGIARGGVEWHRGEIARARVSALYRDAVPGACGGTRAQPTPGGGERSKEYSLPMVSGGQRAPKPQTADRARYTRGTHRAGLTSLCQQVREINMVLRVAPALARRVFAALLTAILTSVAVLMTHEVSGNAIWTSVLFRTAAGSENPAATHHIEVLGFTSRAPFPGPSTPCLQNNHVPSLQQNGTLSDALGMAPVEPGACDKLIDHGVALTSPLKIATQDLQMAGEGCAMQCAWAMGYGDDLGGARVHTPASNKSHGDMLNMSHGRHASRFGHRTALRVAGGEATSHFRDPPCDLRAEPQCQQRARDERSRAAAAGSNQDLDKGRLHGAAQPINESARARAAPLKAELHEKNVIVARRRLFDARVARVAFSNAAADARSPFFFAAPIMDAGRLTSGGTIDDLEPHRHLLYNCSASIFAADDASIYTGDFCGGGGKKNPQPQTAGLGGELGVRTARPFQPCAPTGRLCPLRARASLPQSSLSQPPPPFSGATLGFFFPPPVTNW